MSNAFLGFSTTLSRDGNVVAQLTSIGSVSLDRNMVDVTSHQSTDGIREFIPGLISVGELAIEGYFDSSDTNGQHALKADLIAGTLVPFVVTMPNSVTWTFNAYVKKFETGALSIEGQVLFNASLQVSGVPTLGITLSNAVTATTLSGSGTLIPAWASATYAYVYEVLTGVSSITITPTFSAGTCTITSGTSSQTVATGVASSAITLGSAGSVTVINVKIQETSKAPRTYVINVARA